MWAVKHLRLQFELPGGQKARVAHGPQVHTEGGIVSPGGEEEEEKRKEKSRGREKVGDRIKNTPQVEVCYVRIVGFSTFFFSTLI